MTTDLTRGSVTRHLIGYTVPLILGNLFQLTYNAVDSLVISRFSGDGSLAAVGTADPVMSLLILGVSGVCLGASVLMSNFFGAGDRERLRRELGTSVTLSALFSAAVFLLGLLLARPILRLMAAPVEILPDAALYLRIVLVGMPFTCLYNVYAAALRSVGDSRTPIWFLAGSSLLNGGLDVLFVARFQWGVPGAAAATVIAESLSAAACVLYVRAKVPVLHIRAAHLRLDRELTRKTLRYGGATALQQCSQPVGKLFIQRAVNTLGVSTIAAFNVVGKLEDFALVPERSIGSAMMTFTAQNDGAGDRDRVRRGFWRGMLLEGLYALFILAVVLLLHRPVLALFSDKAAVRVEAGRYFEVMAFFYWLPAVTNGLQGFFRGMKHMKMTLLGTCIQISFRVLFTYLLIPRLGIVGVAYACAVGWTVMLAVSGIYCWKKVY